MMIISLSVVVNAKSIIVYEEYNVTRLDETSYGIELYKGNEETLNLPAQINGFNVKKINDYAFKDNTVVKNISFVSPLESIGEQAFVSNKTISTVSLCSSITEIKALAFSGCTSLKSISLEKSSITEVLGYTFSNTALTSVEIPTTCTAIGYSAFSNNTQLKKIIIPKSTVSIDKTAFDNCPNLQIYCYKDSYAETFAKDNNISYVLLDGPTVYKVGDTDGNDDVDILDATLIQKLIAHIETDRDGKMSERGSYDNSGELIILDATKIQRSLAELPGAELIGTIREYKK